MATGMMALRMRGEERKKIIKYDVLDCYTKDDLYRLLVYLKNNGVRFWIYNGDLYTEDENFGEMIDRFLNGEYE